MLTSFLIVFREGLEAFFVVAIVMSVITRLKRSDLKPFVLAGVALAAFCSVAAGVAVHLPAHHLSGEYKVAFEGALMITACALLTYVMVWFNGHARLLRERFEESADRVVSKGRRWRILSFVFVAVFREGVEIVIFTSAAIVVKDRFWCCMGGALGLLCALFLSGMIYKGILRIPYKHLFTVTSVILIVVAAGLLLQGVGHLQSAGLLPVSGAGHISLDWLMSDESGLGLVLHTLVGYDSNPTVLMLLSYCLYLGAAFAQRSRRISRGTIAR